MKKYEDRKFVSIQTKVSPSVVKRLDSVVERGKFESKYELFQYLISVFLRSADPDNEEEDTDTQEMVEFVRLFDGWDDYKQRVITTKPQGNRHLQLTDIVCVYSEIGKRGYVGKRISFNATGTKITSNIGNILDVVIKKLYPKLYEQLEGVIEQTNERCISKALERIIAATLEDADSRYIDGLLEDEQEAVEYGQVPKKRRRKGIEDV